MLRASQTVVVRYYRGIFDMTRLSDKLETAMKAGTQGDIVLFLDFDGVISTHRAKHATGEWIDPIATALLAKLQREQGFQIVVSSTWRHMEQRCKDALAPSGLLQHLHPDWRTNEDPEGFRPRELDEWLARNGEPDFIILDDDAFAWTGRQMPRWVQTDIYDGFLLKHYQQATTIIAALRERGE